MRNLKAFREGILSYSASKSRSAMAGASKWLANLWASGTCGLQAKPWWCWERCCMWTANRVLPHSVWGWDAGERAQLFDGQRFSGSYWYFALSILSVVVFQCFPLVSPEHSHQLCSAMLQLHQEVMLYGKEVPFSRDVENTAVELLQHLQNRSLRSLRSLFPFGRLHRVPSLVHFWRIRTLVVVGYKADRRTYWNGQKTHAEGSRIL